MNSLSLATRMILSWIIVMLLAGNMLAQVKPYAFPKIKPDDFKYRVYEKDTAAVAVILGDKGESFLEYNDVKGFQLIFTRHLRIRILANDGYDFATHSLSLYRAPGSAESISEIKGYTYNLVDGKVEDEKLGNENIFREEINLNWVRTKFTMPNVKVGSIIDLRYKITSDYLWNLREWQFQSIIPAQWSEYTVTIPEYYIYSKLLHGAVPFAISETTTIPGSISIFSKERELSENYMVKTTFDQTKVDFTQAVYHYAASNVPAIAVEPFSPAMTNFISKVEFELQYSQLPGASRKSYTTTWLDICDDLMRSDDFGAQLQRGRMLKDAVAAIHADNASPLEKVAAAHDFIRSKMIWNDKYGLYPTTDLREAWDKKTGNDADINLMLTLLLKELELDASPVAISTRDNGMLVEQHPVLTQLNYVLASVTIDGKTLLLDATGKHRPMNYLPVRCLNGNGLLVSKDKMRWIPLLGEERDNTLYHADMKLTGDGVVSGVLKVSKSGYAADNVRSEYKKDGEEKYLKSLKEDHKDWQISDFKVENIDSLGVSVNQRYTISSEEIAEQNGNMIYFNTLLGLGQSSNPFKAEKRENLVDFIYPVKDAYVFFFEIPEGYAVESIPESVRLLLPDQAGSFKFIASAAGNKISINSTLSMVKTMFTPAEYADLRNFFALIVAKHAQQIVLKKV